MPNRNRVIYAASTKTFSIETDMAIAIASMLEEYAAMTRHRADLLEVQCFPHRGAVELCRRYADRADDYRKQLEAGA